MTLIMILKKTRKTARLMFLENRKSKDLLIAMKLKVGIFLLPLLVSEMLLLLKLKNRRKNRKKAIKVGPERIWAA
jgi:hypothetical protein